MTDDGDLRLAALLAEPDRAPDEAFAARVTQAVLAEERLRAAKRRDWRRFASDAAASAAVLVAFVLLGAGWPAAEAAGDLPLAGPATTALLLVAVWAVTALRADPGPRRS